MLYKSGGPGITAESPGICHSPRRTWHARGGQRLGTASRSDPELGRGLDPRRIREVANACSCARSTYLAVRGAGPTLASGSQPIGLLVLDGLLVREATVGDHPCAELLGPGDLLRAWDDRDTEVLLPRTVEWTALTHARLASSTRRWPCAPRSGPRSSRARRARRPARRAARGMQAIAHLTRVDDRLLALLWCLAERWGRVVPGGVLVILRLPHRTLAGMVGARRPSVTTALGQLIARNEIERRARRRLAAARRSAGAPHRSPANSQAHAPDAALRAR